MSDEDSPVVPNLASVQGRAVSTTKAVPVVTATPIAALPEVLEEPPAERYWTEDRLIRIGLWLAFLFLAGGLVVTLSRWELLAAVPPVPWLVGLALVAGPAWKAYIDYAEEAKGRRTREEQAKTAYGVQVRAPRDRHAG